MEGSKDMILERALKMKGLFHVTEAEVFTSPSDTKFLLALLLTVRPSFESPGGPILIPEYILPVHS